MNFTYSKREPSILIPGDAGTIHVWVLEGTSFEIMASSHGVTLGGHTGLFQPVHEERKIPEDFRQFFTRLADAFEFSFKEQEKERKESAARKMILGGL